MKSGYEIKKEICEIGKSLHAAGFVPGSGGSISVKVDDNTYYCTPSGVSKGRLTPDMIAKVDGNGNKLEGSLKPSSEFKSQLQIYRERPDVKAVIYAYPPVATAYAASHQTLDAPLTAAILLAVGAVPICEYGTPGTAALTDPLMPYVKDHNSFLMRNFGAITVGDSLLKAYYNMECLEHFAQVSVNTALLGGAAPMTDAQVDALLHPNKDAVAPVAKKADDTEKQVESAVQSAIEMASGSSCNGINNDSLIEAVTQLVMRELKNKQ